MGEQPTDTPPVFGDQNRNEDDRERLLRSYFFIRLALGVIGFAIPLMLWGLDSIVFKGGQSLKGSLSAYYHTGARDLFVAALSVTGFLLITYMVGDSEKLGYKLSTVAGVAALGIAFLPTKRIGLTEGATLCGPGPSSLPRPDGCAPLQQAFGESIVAGIHFFFTGLFIVMIAAICWFVFAKNERHAGLYKLCAGVIALAMLITLVGTGIGRSFDIQFWIQPLYIGEVMSVYAFALAWLTASLDLLTKLRSQHRTTS